MDDGRRNREIEHIANMMVHDGVSPDEQDASRLRKYRDEVMSDCSLGEKDAMQLVYETLLYRKLKKADTSADPLQKGSKFGAGFS